MWWHCHMRYLQLRQQVAPSIRHVCLGGGRQGQAEAGVSARQIRIVWSVSIEARAASASDEADESG